MSGFKPEKPSIIKAIQSIESSTEVQFSAVSQVRKAFLLGLWYKSFPDYMLEHLNQLYTWDLREIDPEVAKGYECYPNSFKFQFISDTGDSWHQCYRDLRNRGWQRLKVHRDGGRLQYLFKLSAGILQADPEWYPEGYRELHLLLDISISTCKQVQVGTEIKEVPVMKTVCEDLADDPTELEPGEGVRNNEEFKSLMEEATNAEVTQLVVIDDIEELQSRRDGEFQDDTPF